MVSSFVGGVPALPFFILGGFMSTAEILGWARSILDSYGVTQIITVMLIVSAAFYVYRRFFDKD